jgi:hypothetical protein
MKDHEKLVAACSIAPVIADFLEDCIDSGLIRFKMKQEANKLIAQIRRFDELIMSTASIESIDEQILIQTWLRNELTTHLQNTTAQHNAEVQADGNS